jgi:flavodoxin
MDAERNDPGNSRTVRSLVVVFSYHHNNTRKIAETLGNVLDAPVKTPQQVTPEELSEYDLIGFGSGIYSATLDPSVLDLVNHLPTATGKKAFIFSTYGAPAFVATREFVMKNHEEIRKKLQAKGYTIIGEFGCAGHNTNSFLKYFGGLNKGHPDAGDLKNAELFARDLKRKTGATR